MVSPEHTENHTGLYCDFYPGQSYWHVLVIDDNSSIHEITAHALDRICFAGRPLRLFHAYCSTQAKQALASFPHIALILLDIALENQDDGLDLIRWIRNTLGNTSVQIAVRTGKCDRFMEEDIVDTYDINDFLSKTDATSQKLQILVKKAIRSFKSQSDLEMELCRRREIQARLREKEAQHQDLIDNIGDVVWQTNKAHKLIDISGNMEPVTGFHVSEWINKPFDFAMTGECRSRVWPEIKETMDQGRRFSNLEISRIHKKGQTKYFLTSGKPVRNVSGKLIGYRGAEKDITELVHAEMEKKKLISQLRHAQRLEAMGTLAGGIAHDFNNILGGILGYAQLLQFDFKDSPQALSHITHIISGCQRAKNLILQILDFSRQRENTSPDRLTHPGTIVEETCKLLRASIPSSIAIHTSISDETGLIRADPSQIHQAVMNLCTNAAQAIETAMGEISIKVGPVRLTPENHTKSPALDLDHGEYIIISVEDTGKGIEEATLEKIFNPYFTTKKRGDGTGLGLSVVHGIITRFDGAITIDTIPGKGTCFTLYFPKHVPKKNVICRRKSPLYKGKANVLFIDDEPMLVDIGRMMLEKLGYAVTATKAPLTALETVRKDPGRFDIVITDMTMPEIHGSQLALKIKDIRPRLPVVLATGFSNIVQTQKATPSGIDAVLPKPITMGNLSRTLHQLLEDQRNDR